MPELPMEIWQYRVPMLRLAASILHHPQNAEDAVSHAMLMAVQHMDALRDPAALRPWLMKITARSAYDILRFEKRERLHAQQQPDACTLFESAQETLFAQLQRLPRSLSQVLVLYYYEGFTARDISAALGISAATVRMRLSRGRRKLRAIVEEEEA